MSKTRPPSLKNTLLTTTAGGVPTKNLPANGLPAKNHAPSTMKPHKITSASDAWEIPTIAAVSPTQTPTASTTKTILVISVATERLATLIGTKIHAWILPTGQDIEIHVIASEEELETQKVASLLMHLGYNQDDVNQAFPTITLGWPDDRPDTP